MANNDQTFRSPIYRSAFEIPGDVFNTTPPRIVFGSGCVARLKSEVERLEARRVLVITTPGREAMGERLSQALGAQSAGVYAKAVSQVPIELARAARSEVEAMNVDCLVSVGGGAAIGLGKAIALDTGLAFVAVPTTYSGSEMTGFCGITIDGVKRMHASLRMLPDTVLYDPELTLSLPAKISVESAMNALAHCIEAPYVRTTSPVIALAALEGVRVLRGSLPRVVGDPDDLDARESALFGAYLGGVALTGGFALHHGVAHVLGASYGVPHAVAHSVALPYTTAFNEDTAPAVSEKLAQALGAGTVAVGVHDFATAVGAPVCLGDHGFTRDDVERCAALVMDTDNGLNPRPLDAAGVRELLEAALEGRRPA